MLPPEATQVDAEAELAVVIGAPARRLTPERALDVVAGYIAANDVSARNLQYGDGQWLRGKGFDTLLPRRPGARRRPSELDDASDLRVVQRLNGEVHAGRAHERPDLRRPASSSRTPRRSSRSSRAT